MKKELLELGFTEEQVESVLKLVGENTIPRDKFNEVNEAKKQLEKDVKSRDKQLEDLKASNESNEQLKSQIETLQKTNKETEEKYLAEISKIKLDNALDSALTVANAKNLKAVKALLNLENVKLDENGALQGLEEQLKTLQSAEDSKFLFETKQEPKEPTFSGVQPGTGVGEGSVPSQNNGIFGALQNLYKQ